MTGPLPDGLPDDGHAGDLVSAWLDGELDPATTTWVDEHLAGCDPCRAAADEARLARQWVRSLPSVDGSEVVSGFLGRHRAMIRTGTTLVGVAAVALGAIALSSAVLHPEVVPEIDALVDAHLAAHDAPAEPHTAMAESGADGLSGVRVVQHVAGHYAAPAAVLGNRARLSRRAMFDGDDVTVVVYGDGRSSVSVFEQPGWLEWDALPEGAIRWIGERRVWERDGSPAVLVAEVGGLVVTLVSDDRAAMTTVVDALPEKHRGSTWDRLHDACARFTETFAPS